MKVSQDQSQVETQVDAGREQKNEESLKIVCVCLQVCRFEKWRNTAL